MATETKLTRYTVSYNLTVAEMTEYGGSKTIMSATSSETAPIGTEDPIAYLRARLRKEFGRKAEESANASEDSI